IGLAAAGAIAGFLPYLALSHSARASHGQTTFSLAVLSRNARILWDECLPWALSARAWYSPDGASYAPWQPGPGVGALQALGAIVFALSIVAGAWLFASRRVPWEARRLGIIGASAFPVTISAFLVSPMVMDAYSTRYLASIVLFAPFALAPLALRLGLA